MSFVINQAPRNGSCSITPLTGTTSTVFTVSCPNWEDSNGIQDYTIYSEDQTMIAFSSMSTMQVRLPAGQANTSLLQLFVVIRDAMDCVAEANVLSAVVRRDSSAIDEFVSAVQALSSLASTNALNRLPLVQALYSGNQNAIGQVLSSLSQQFNGISTQALQTVADSECRSVRSGRIEICCSVLGVVSLSNVSVSLLGHTPQSQVRDDEVTNLFTLISVHSL